MTVRRTFLLALSAAAAVAAAAGCAAPTTIEGTGIAAPARTGETGSALPSGRGGIGPGSQLYTEIDGQLFSCTANFLFTGGGAVYLGSAAHCHAPSEADVIDGCATGSLPLGTPVAVVGPDGTRITARLAYSSWGTMQDIGETDEDRCLLNDLALLEIAPADIALLDPTVPVFGGPTGLDPDGPDTNETVVSYQNDEEPAPFRVMRAKQGVNLGAADDAGLGWIVQTTTPGLPGDSGSGYLDADGDAFGVLSTVAELEDGSIVNSVTDLAQALDYAAEHGEVGELDVVVSGTPFSVDGVPMDALPQEQDRLDLRDLLARGLDLLDEVLDR